MRLTRSIQWRIALGYTGLIVLTMTATSVYFFIFARGSYLSDLEERHEHEAGLIAQSAARYFQDGIDLEGLQAVSQRVGALIDGRVTMISVDGTVLSDTAEAPAALENQASRPEIRDALATGVGRSTRFSTATDRDMAYTAVPILVDGAPVGVARIAVSKSEVQSGINEIIAAVAISGLIITVLAVVLGYLLARRTSRSVRSVADGARRLAQGDLEHRVYAPFMDETRELADTLNSMAADLRATNQELGAERNRFSAMLETMADGVVMIGPEGEVTLLNQVARNLLDVRVPEGLGRRFIEISRNYDLHLLISRALKTTQPQFEEVELPDRRYISAIAVPLMQNAPSPGVLLTLHDLSRVRQLDTTRREFVSNVSHELRNPLASIKAAVETLENGALGEPEIAKDFVHRIHGDVDRMISMAGDLLELSSLESGQVPLHLYPLDISLLLKEVTSSFEASARTNGIVVDMVPDEQLPFAMGNDEQLRQVLVNLLDNAIKSTPTKGKVALSAKADEQFIEVQVTDTGVGLSRDHQAHIFERFYKVDRSRHDGGTGLGLAIVKHIVQLHGGDVKVESEEGAGATFTFTVPRAQ